MTCFTFESFDVLKPTPPPSHPLLLDGRLGVGGQSLSTVDCLRVGLGMKVDQLRLLAGSVSGLPIAMEEKKSLLLPEYPSSVPDQYQMLPLSKENLKLPALGKIHTAFIISLILLLLHKLPLQAQS